MSTYVWEFFDVFRSFLEELDNRGLCYNANQRAACLQQTAGALKNAISAIEDLEDAYHQQLQQLVCTYACHFSPFTSLLTRFGLIGCMLQLELSVVQSAKKKRNEGYVLQPDLDPDWPAPYQPYPCNVNDLYGERFFFFFFLCVFGAFLAILLHTEMVFLRHFRLQALHAPPCLSALSAATTETTRALRWSSIESQSGCYY